MPVLKQPTGNTTVIEVGASALEQAASSDIGSYSRFYVMISVAGLCILLAFGLVVVKSSYLAKLQSVVAQMREPTVPVSLPWPEHVVSARASPCRASPGEAQIMSSFVHDEDNVVRIGPGDIERIIEVDPEFDCPQTPQPLPTAMDWLIRQERMMRAELRT